jgi:hypothetical protein
MENFSCDCGGKVTKQQGKFRFFPYGEYGMIKLTKARKVLICSKCGEYYQNADDSSLQEGLKESLTDNAVQLINLIKNQHGLRDNQLAFFCGVTPAAFSRFKNKDSGKVLPSYAFLLLKGIAQHGEKFIKDLLDATWEVDEPVSNSSGDQSSGHTGLAAKAYTG